MPTRIFEPLWNRDHVDHVQITVAEDIGVEGRGKFYEPPGTLRDIVQNHAMQLLTLVAMEPPVAFDADAVRDEKVKVVRAMRPIAAAGRSAGHVRGQYGTGGVRRPRGAGLPRGARRAPDSITETFVAMKLHVDNWRWHDVPFYVRAGKRLAKRVTEIAVQFKPVPHRLFSQRPAETATSWQCGSSPTRGSRCGFVSKVPGPRNALRAGQHGLPLRHLVRPGGARGV